MNYKTEYKKLSKRVDKSRLETVGKIMEAIKSKRKHLLFWDVFMRLNTVLTIRVERAKQSRKRVAVETQQFIEELPKFWSDINSSSTETDHIIAEAAPKIQKFMDTVTEEEVQLVYEHAMDIAKEYGTMDIPAMH